MQPELCVLRGGGDIATGVAWRLTRAGWPVIVCELAAPLTVRRTVALSSAVSEGCVDVEGMIGRLADDPAGAVELARHGEIGVVVAPELPRVGADVVIDARLAKRRLDTTLTDAHLVIGIGPGFEPGVDCHAAVESMRGPHLGRVLWEDSPEPNTGTPGRVAGAGAERVVRAPIAGDIEWRVAIGDVVAEGEVLGQVTGEAEATVPAPLGGIVRGLISGGRQVQAGLKIGDIDPRADVSLCHEISDKALAIGGGVLEAVLTWPDPSR